MLHVNYLSWNQTPEDLRELSLNSEHPRTRERFLALYDITMGKNTIQVGKETGRHHQSIMAWVHKYNQYGAESLLYQRSGGRPPFFVKK